MKLLFTIISFLSLAIVSSCDFRSGTAKEEMDKFSGTPTPSITPLPSPPAIDPADVVEVDTTMEGDRLTVNGHSQTKTLTCAKFDRVKINGNGNLVTIDGPCRQIMVNGDENRITADAAAEFVLNGTGNSLTYSRFVNGKQPLVAENRPGNVIEKTAFDLDKSSRSQKNGKK